MQETSFFARTVRAVAKVEPSETKMVVLSFFYFFLLMVSYFVIRPLRETMGTVYGVDRLEELFTGTFVVSIVATMAFAAIASRLKLSTFLPWVYGFVAITLVAFAFLLRADPGDRILAAAFYVWVSTFNLLTISVFWSFMADMLSREQAKRLFGVVAAGGTCGTIAAPLFVTLFGEAVGEANLILISAAGFAVTGLLVRQIEVHQARLRRSQDDQAAPATDPESRLGGSFLDGFRLILASRYLMLIALFLLLMTWISTVLYFQLSSAITDSFAATADRTRAFATIDLATNSATLLVQFFGTSRFLQKLGVTWGLLVNPAIMVVAFLAIVFSPVLLMLGTVQVIRRFAEYSIAKPSRDLLYTAVDPQAKYKAKNVIDTVVYRFGDLSAAWLSAMVLPFGIAGLAIFGAVIAVVWFPIAFVLGRKFEAMRDPADGRNFAPDNGT
ncbi:NTP/NDP exchange transporter [Tsuneonella sp. HG222]